MSTRVPPASRKISSCSLVAEDDSVFDEILPDVTQALQAALDKGNQDALSLQQVMRRTVGRFVGRRLRRRPMIVPVVIEA